MRKASSQLPSTAERALRSASYSIRFFPIAKDEEHGAIQYVDNGSFTFTFAKVNGTGPLKLIHASRRFRTPEERAELTQLAVLGILEMMNGNLQHVPNRRLVP